CLAPDNGLKADMSARLFRATFGLMRCSKKTHSITSSAVICSVSGTSRPSALAVLRLMTNWNFVGCCTRQVRWFFAFENAVDVGGSTLEWVDAINSIGDQAAV